MNQKHTFQQQCVWKPVVFVAAIQLVPPLQELSWYLLLSFVWCTSLLQIALGNFRYCSQLEGHVNPCAIAQRRFLRHIDTVFLFLSVSVRPFDQRICLPSLQLWLHTRYFQVAVFNVHLIVLLSCFSEV